MSWAGFLSVDTGVVTFIGPAGAAAPHAHHALQLVVGLDAPVTLSLGRRRLSRRATVVQPGTPHALDAGGGRIALWLFDATHSGLASHRHHSSGVELAAPPPWTGPPGSWASQALAAWGIAPLPRVRSRFTRAALHFIDASLEGVPRLAAAARHVGLSPGRLSHLFAAEVGLPFRNLVLWRRLERAAAAGRTGASLTASAHAAGFSDAAHLSRTFRAHFGLAPSLVWPLLSLQHQRSSR